MGKLKAFTRGFWSVLDLGFSETRQEFLRKPYESFDLQKERERLGISNLNCWDSVGMSIRQAMNQFEQEANVAKIKSKK